MTPPEYILIGGKRVVADSFVDPTDGNTYYQPIEKLAIGADAGTAISVGNPLPVVDAAIAALQTADHADLAALLTQLTSFTTADHADLAAVLTGLGPLALQTTLAAILAAGAGDVATTLTDGRKTSTTPGTAVPLVAASTPCKWVQVTALTSNASTSQVNVGGATVLATSGSSTGTPLAAGQSTTIPVNDVAKIFVDVRTSGDGVSFTWGA